MGTKRKEIPAIEDVSVDPEFDDSTNIIDFFENKYLQLKEVHI